MALSEEGLTNRYGQFSGALKIEKMIEDMVDTPIIMQEVRAYGNRRYSSGVSHGLSRSQSRPGFGDMGG